MTKNIKPRIYFENLDGLRFLCFLSVFFYHSFHTINPLILQNPIYNFIKKNLFGNGNLGVNFFFVLSGFLITYLLIEEKRQNIQINIKNFWIRRMLRIWPLFYFSVFFGFVIFPAIKHFFNQVSSETADPFFYIFFINNFDFIKKGLPDSSILGVLWSVAIEEQFYLIWPIIVYIFPLKKLWIPLVIIIILNVIFRAKFDDYLAHEYHTLSCIGDMIIGALGAWFIYISTNFKKTIENLPKGLIGVLYAIFFIIFFFREEVFYVNHGVRIFERLIIAIVILLIILEQTYSKQSFYKMSEFIIISKLGSITYGLYCLHFIGILITITLTEKFGLNTSLWQVIILETSLSLAVTIIISKLSYNYFEMPFLRFKNKFAFFTK